MEIFGIICTTLIAGGLIFWLMGFGLMGLTWGGPTLINWSVMIFLTALSVVVGYCWWIWVGVNIHVSVG
jgi:hypothetical protein